MIKTFEDMEYFAPAEQLVKILGKKTQSDNPLFFRVSIAYHMAKIASMMHTTIKTPDRGDIPVSLYALNLAPSGFGKGLSNNIIEDSIIKRFKDKFMNETYPFISTDNLYRLAAQRAAKNKTDVEHELTNVEREFGSTGAMVFSFDSATPAAVKQIRHKILMSGLGSLCLEMDEVGSNFTNNIEALNAFIELYDVGKIKEKITLNSAENKRKEHIDGRTPTNMLLFGTPTKLLDGAKTESDFFTMLETGYARRCLFGYAEKANKTTASMTPEELYDMMTDSTSDLTLDTMAVRLEHLADPGYYNTKLGIAKDVSLELISYQIHCSAIADTMADHEEIQKAEISHRYFRALKLSGAYAFIDNSPEITINHLHAAIKLIEDSGVAFQRIMTREKPYVKLAKYISDINEEVTQVDLMEDLPFYKGSVSQRSDMMNLAIAYGYKNNIVIKKSYIDGIEFLRGESLKETDINKIMFSYSTDITTGYELANAPFNQLHELTGADGYHYTAHAFKDGYRESTKVLPGFNLVIIDVDKDCSINTAKLLLQDYTYHISTTKRHQKSGHGDRFRVILPLSHTLKLNAKDFGQFMSNLFEWLPFSVDIQTKDIARKWESNKDAEYFYNEGEMLDATLFIPQTKKSEDQLKASAAIGNMSNLERWFLNNTGEGNRNNMVRNYALALVDNNYTLEAIHPMVMSFNSKIVDPLSETEIATTIMLTVAKRVALKENAND